MKKLIATQAVRLAGVMLLVLTVVGVQLISNHSHGIILVATLVGGFFIGAFSLDLLIRGNLEKTFKDLADTLIYTLFR